MTTANSKQAPKCLSNQPPSRPRLFSGLVCTPCLPGVCSACQQLHPAAQPEHDVHEKRRRTPAMRPQCVNACNLTPLMEIPLPLEKASSRNSLRPCKSGTSLSNCNVGEKNQRHLLKLPGIPGLHVTTKFGIPGPGSDNQISRRAETLRVIHASMANHGCLFSELIFFEGMFTSWRALPR